MDNRCVVEHLLPVHVLHPRCEERAQFLRARLAPSKCGRDEPVRTRRRTPEEGDKSPKSRFDTASAAQPQSTSTFETEPRATSNTGPKAAFDTEQKATFDTEPKATFDVESDVLSVMSDPLPLSIVFEKSTNLDLYVLYVNFLGLMLWGTFISFNFSTPDTNFFVMSGIVLGWTFHTLSGQCRCHESKTPPVAGEKLRMSTCRCPRYAAAFSGQQQGTRWPSQA